MSKSAAIAALVCANLLLLAALCLSAYSGPRALAQGTGLAKNYLAVSAEIQDQHDALYLLDMRERTLHVFIWDKGRRQLLYSDWRDLERDFRHNRD